MAHPVSGHFSGSISATAAGSSHVISRSGSDDKEVIERTLKVAQGQGKLIMAACTPEQKAYELGHGLFRNCQKIT